jgi:hypothetical protein
VSVFSSHGVGPAACAKADVAPPSRATSASIGIENLVIVILQNGSFEQITNVIASSMPSAVARHQSLRMTL